MCFSASASFTAATLLTSIGCVSYAVATKKRYYLFAAIPLLFALQQATEGFIWLYPHNAILPYIYLSFALIIWPTWVPLSFVMYGVPQRNALRVKIVALLGVLLSCILSYLLYAYANYRKPYSLCRIISKILYDRAHYQLWIFIYHYHSILFNACYKNNDGRNISTCIMHHHLSCMAFLFCINMVLFCSAH